MKRSLRLGVATTLATTALAAAAAPEFTFGGYGTLSAVHADSKTTSFRANWRQDKGSHGNVDFGVDSRLGVQGTAKFNETFSATGQLLAIRRDGEDKVDIEWLYAQAELAEGLSARIGRVALPAFMLSDSRNVGYSQHWVRTPAQAYLGFPVTSIDGAQATYRVRLGDTNLTVQPSIGQAKAKLYFDLGPQLGMATNDSEWKRLASLNISAETGDWLFRLGHTVTQEATNKYVSHPFIPTDRFRDAFTGVGAQYDNGSLLVMAEYITRRTSGQVFDTRGYYLTGGYRFGAWMPYAIHSRLTYTGVALAGLDPATTNAAGVRWDFHSSASLKLQYERASQTGQQFLVIDPSGKKVGISTLALDFVF